VEVQPSPISATEMESRLRRIRAMSLDLGFVGKVEYRHVYSQSGGAQYCIGPSVDDDIMVVYAEAFDRNADPEDFSLEAMIAHECGHQRLHRDSKMRKVLTKFPGDALEEIVASVLGAILLGKSESAQTLKWKAAAELTDLGVTADYARSFVADLGKLLRNLL